MVAMRSFFIRIFGWLAKNVLFVIRRNICTLTARSVTICLEKGYPNSMMKCKKETDHLDVYLCVLHVSDDDKKIC
jgi:hypothetical protein